MALEDKFGRAMVPKNFMEHYNAFNRDQEDIEHTGLGPNSGMYTIDFFDPNSETTQVYTSGEFAGEPVDAVHCCRFYEGRDFLEAEGLLNVWLGLDKDF